MGSHRGHKSSQEVQGNGVLLSGAQAAQGHRAQLGCEELSISSTAVLGRCRSPGTGSREQWGWAVSHVSRQSSAPQGSL